MRPFIKMLLGITGRNACLPLYTDSSLALNETYSHPADCVIAYTLTLADVTSVGITFRRVDDSNLWYLNINANGSGALERRVAGSFSGQLTFGAGTFADADRIAIYCNGDSMGVYLNGTLLQTHTSSTHNTAITGKMLGLGTGGAAADLKVWHPTCRGLEGIA